MTELTTPMYDDMDDIELIVTYLQGRLPADRAAAVKRRLKADPAFLELAAPLLLTWSVPKHIERKPRPEGELERDWAEFVKRTGFPERRQAPPAAPPEPPAPAPAPTRKRWSIGRLFEIGFWSVMIYVIVLAFGAVLWFDVIKPTYFPDPTDGWVAPPTSPGPVVVTAAPETLGRITRVRHDTAWVPIAGTGIQVRQALGADLSVAERRSNGKWVIVLDSGTVRFRVGPLTSADPAEGGNQIRVDTRNGFVTAGESEFTVRAREDTTDVEVHASGLPGSGIRPVQATLVILHGPDKNSKIYNLPLAAGQRARLVRGEVPVRFRSNP